MKKLSCFILSLASLLFAASCGKPMDSQQTGSDWKTRNYVDYDTLYVSEEKPEGYEGYFDYWETKPVSYQFVNDKTGAENHGFANFFPTLRNLYEDGSIKAWEKGSFIPNRFDPRIGSTGQEEQNQYNSDYKLLELFYGYWEIDQDNRTIHVISSVDYDSEGADARFTSYTFSKTPDAETKKISFYFNCTEKGQAIKSLFSCDTTFEGTIQYSSYANFSLGKNVNAEKEAQ